MTANALRAIEKLGIDERRVTLFDTRVLPPDPAMIDRALDHDRVITVEDGTRHGGAGALMVSSLRSRAQELGRPFPNTRILGVPRAYLQHHQPDALLRELGLDDEGLAASFARSLRDEPEFLGALPEAPRPIYL
jgi:1-deoxy-D-xylulose-5-phosphate synthase